MADFINFEAEDEVVEVEDGTEDDEVSNISEDSFINDQEVGAMLIFIDNLQLLKMILTKF